MKWEKNRKFLSRRAKVKVESEGKKKGRIIALWKREEWKKNMVKEMLKKARSNKKKRIENDWEEQ